MRTPFFHILSAVPRRVVLAAAALGLAVYVWNDLLKYRFIPKRFGVVEPGLIYRSGQISKWVIGDVLDRHGIAVVVDLQWPDVADEHHLAEISATQRRGIVLERFSLDGDGTGDLERYADAVAAIARAAAQGRPVLVHCGAGAKRTGGVVALYRVLIQGDPSDEAYSELKRYGWRANNPTLPRFLNAHMPQLAELLVARGVLKAVPDRLPVIGASETENRRRAPRRADDAGLVDLR
ncbi:MAG TPA: tyrosine-protein phosphatase [Planctomycetaceae bacterium]|nr:tyrosine-protein phosphatase [Planctomycetaceae bacterium]